MSDWAEIQTLRLEIETERVKTTARTLRDVTNGLEAVTSQLGTMVALLEVVVDHPDRVDLDAIRQIVADHRDWLLDIKRAEHAAADVLRILREDGYLEEDHADG